MNWPFAARTGTACGEHSDLAGLRSDERIVAGTGCPTGPDPGRRRDLQATTMCSAASAAKSLAGRWALSGPLLVVKVGVLDSWHDVLDDEVRHRPQRSVAQLVDQICPGGHIVSLSKQTSEGDAGPRLGIEPTDRDHVVAAQQRLDVLSDDALSFRSAQDKPCQRSGQVDEEAQTGPNHPDFFP